MLNDALAHCPADIVGDTYYIPKTEFYPSMYIGMLNGDHPLRWGDVDGLANGLIALVKEANWGEIPTVTGRGWEYWGDIYLRGLLQDHKREGLEVGHFYMGRY